MGAAEDKPPTPSISPGRADFDSINGSSSGSSSDGSCTRSDSSNTNDGGDLFGVVGRPARDVEVFDELPAAKRTHKVPAAGLDQERVLRGRPAGVRH